MSLIPDREAMLPPRFRAGLDRERRAFSKAFARAAITPAPWNCARGMHDPLFFDEVWVCNSCMKPLDERARFA